MQSVRDYSCTFKKREVVNGKLLDQQTMFVKSRPAPLSVYMYFLDQDVRGQEAIYVEGRNNGTSSLTPSASSRRSSARSRLPRTIRKRWTEIVTRSHRSASEFDAHVTPQANVSDMQHGETEVRIVEGCAGQ